MGYDGECGQVMRDQRSYQGNTFSPMLRFIIALMVFVVIAGTAGRYFSSAFDSVEVTEANTAVQGYATSVINVHKNWILQGRPSKVSIRSLDDFGNPANEWIFIMNEHYRFFITRFLKTSCN